MQLTLDQAMLIYQRDRQDRQRRRRRGLAGKRAGRVGSRDCSTDTGSISRYDRLVASGLERRRGHASERCGSNSQARRERALHVKENEMRTQSEENQTLRRMLEQECDDVDRLLVFLGLDPEQCRTDGGMLNVPRTISLFEDLRDAGCYERKPK